MEQKRSLHVQLRCGSMSNTTPELHLANEFDIQSELHGQAGLAAVNKLCVVHEALNCCKILKTHLRLALKV